MAKRIEVRAEVTGSVWKIVAAAGSRVEADEPIVIVESMKMEIPVASEVAGTVLQIHVQEGEAVESGQLVAVIEG